MFSLSTVFRSVSPYYLYLFHEPIRGLWTLSRYSFFSCFALDVHGSSLSVLFLLFFILPKMDFLCSPDNGTILFISPLPLLSLSLSLSLSLPLSLSLFRSTIVMIPLFLTSAHYDPIGIPELCCIEKRFVLVK